MNSVEKVKKLCKDKKIPISRLERDLGYANGYIGQLKKGSFPDDRLRQIAQYLDVPVNYLLGLTDTENQDKDTENNNLNKDPDIELIQRARSKMTNKQRKKMMDLLRLSFDDAFGRDEEE